MDITYGGDANCRMRVSNTADCAVLRERLRTHKFGLYATIRATLSESCDVLLSTHIVGTLLDAFPDRTVDYVGFLFIVCDVASLPWTPCVARALVDAAVPPRLLLEGPMIRAALRQPTLLDTWTSADWDAVVRASRATSRDTVIPRLFEAVVTHSTDATLLYGIRCGFDTCLEARPRIYAGVSVDWVRLHRQFLGNRAEFVERRITVGGTEYLIWCARGASVQSVRRAASNRGASPFALLWAQGERLEEDRTIEEYGLDDDTPLAIA